MAALLPEEILVLIMEAASISVSSFDSLNTWFEPTWLCNYALVCKRWASPAQQVLYRAIQLEDTVKIVLLYEGLRNRTPQFGQFTRVLDTSTMLTNAGDAILLARILPLMPQTTSLAICAGQCRPLRDLAVWSSISHLHLVEVYNLAGTLTSNDFPRRLQTLTIRGSSTLLKTGGWSNIYLPEVHSFALHKTSDTGFGLKSTYDPANVSTSPRLPSMPRLRRLENSQPTTTEQGFEDELPVEPLLVCILIEAAPVLQELELTEMTDMPSLFGTLSTEDFCSLHTLKYQGCIQGMHTRLYRRY